MNDLLAYVRARLLELDRLLRGVSTRPQLFDGQSPDSHTLNISARGLTVGAILLAMIYGACMGSFSLMKEVPAELDDPYGPLWQLLATTIKTPALFLLTLIVTLPSLYVSNALIGSRLTALGLARLLVASIAVNVAVLASLGTIVLFFSLTTNSYPFILLLNVAAFTIAGVLGLMFLLQTLHRLTTSDSIREDLRAIDGESLGENDDNAPIAAQLASPEESDKPDDQRLPSPIEMPKGQVLGRHTRLVFRCWIVLFALVGAQMGWVLRPFVGNPELPFTLFRERDSNFFSAVLGALGKLLFGN